MNKLPIIEVSMTMRNLFNLIFLLTLASCVSTDLTQVQFPFPKPYHLMISKAELIQSKDNEWLLRVKDGLVRKRTFAIMKSAPALEEPPKSGQYDWALLTFVEKEVGDENIEAIHKVRFHHPVKLYIGGQCGIGSEIEIVRP